VKISEARKIVDAKYDAGLMTWNEATRAQTNLSRVQASNHNYKLKSRLYAVWACEESESASEQMIHDLYAI